MSQPWVLRASGTVLTAVMVASLATIPSYAAPAPEGAVLVAAGDSFTAGGPVSKDAAYPAIAGTDLGYEVQNVAVNGSKSNTLVEQLAGTDADVAVFTTGGNDINALQAIGGGEAEALAKLPALQETLTSVFDAAADTAPEVYAVTYAQILGSCMAPAAAALSALNDTIIAAAQAADIGVIDAEGALLGHTMCDPEPWVADGHPTAQGQAAVGHLVAAAIGDDGAVVVDPAPEQPTVAPALPSAVAPSGADDESAWWAFLWDHREEIQGLLAGS